MLCNSFTIISIFDMALLDINHIKMIYLHGMLLCGKE